MQPACRDWNSHTNTTLVYGTCGSYIAFAYNQQRCSAFELGVMGSRNLSTGFRGGSAKSCCAYHF
jgi:hypothetical protein